MDQKFLEEYKRWKEQQEALRSVDALPQQDSEEMGDLTPSDVQQFQAPEVPTLTQQSSQPEILFGKNDLSTVEALKDAQKQRDRLQMEGEIAKGGALISQGLSGVENKGLKEIGEGLIKKSGDKVTDFTAQVEIQKKDPNSAVSQGYKAFLEKQMGIKLGGDVSAANIEPFLTASMKKQVQSKAFQQGFVDEQGNKLVFDPNSGKYISSGLKAADTLFQAKDPLTGIVNLLGRRAKSGGGLDIKGTIGGPKQATGKEESGSEIYSTLDDKTRTKVDATKKMFLDDTKEDRNAVVSARGIKQMIAAGKEMKGDVLRAIQNQLARANGEKGTMTEGDIQGFGGKADVLSRLSRFASMSTTGEMTDSDRKFLSDLSEVMERRANDYINKQSEVYTDNISTVSGGLPTDKARTLLGVEHTMTSNRNKPQASSQKSSGKTIVKKGYNSKTDETQLVYSDGSKEIVKGRK